MPKPRKSIEADKKRASRRRKETTLDEFEERANSAKPVHDKEWAFNGERQDMLLVSKMLTKVYWDKEVDKEVFKTLGSQ